MISVNCHYYYSAAFQKLTRTQKIIIIYTDHCYYQTVGSLTAQDEQGTHKQLSQNIKTVFDDPGYNTQY